MQGFSFSVADAPPVGVVADLAGGRGERGAKRPPPLPCLDTNNSDKGTFPTEWQRLTSAHRKTAAVLQWNVVRLAEVYGIQNLGFLTLTFADHVTCAREASRRFNNLSRRVLGRYREWIRVLERQKSRRVHYHLLVVLADDIRTGANFDEFEKGVYRSANGKLRSEWAFWRKAAPSYGFGRTELLPVKSSQEAIAKYVGKYVSKHVGQRIEEDKGVRLVAYSRGANNSNCKFSWASPGAKNHRRKLAFLGKALGYSPSTYAEEFRRDFGSRWAYHLGPWLAAIRFNTYPTGEELLSDWPHANTSDFPAGSVDCSIYGSDINKTVSQSQGNAILMAFDLRKRNHAKLENRMGDGLGRRNARLGGCGDGDAGGTNETGCGSFDGRAGSDGRIGRGTRRASPPVNNFKTSNQPHTQRVPIRSEHCQGGDFCASDATEVLDDWMRKNTTFTSATEDYNESAKVG